MDSTEHQDTPRRNRFGAGQAQGTLAGMLECNDTNGSPHARPTRTTGQRRQSNLSTRPRRTADVEDLHWELTQATKWRDGLPGWHTHWLVQLPLAQAISTPR